MGILGFLVFLLVAAACAWVADYFVPGRIPGGFLAAAIVGLIGAWLGTALLGNLGPDLGGVSVFSAIIGSGLLVFAMSLLGRGTARNS